MKAVPATSASFHANFGSDSEEEEVPQLVRRPRASRGDPVLGARSEHLRTPSRSSLPPQRPAPAVPTAGMSSAGGTGEQMLEVKDIPLTTRPTAWPAPQRPAPPIPTTGKSVAQAGDTPLKTQAPSLLEQQRPAPISTVLTPGAEPADEEWRTPLNSPSQLALPVSPVSVSSLLSLSTSTSPSSTIPSPSWPPSPASTSAAAAAAPEATGAGSPTEALRHPDDVAHVGERADQLAEPLDELWGLRVPRLPPYMDRDALIDAKRFLARHAHLLDMKDLRNAQAGLRDLLENGVQEGRLPGVSRARLGDLRALSEVDLRSLTEPLRKFKAGFAEIYDEVVNVRGGDPNWFTRRARPIEDIEAQRAARIAADNKALEAGHYTF